MWEDIFGTYVLTVVYLGGGDAVTLRFLKYFRVPLLIWHPQQSSIGTRIQKKIFFSLSTDYLFFQVKHCVLNNNIRIVVCSILCFSKVSTSYQLCTKTIIIDVEAADRPREFNNSVTHGYYCCEIIKK